MPTAAFAVLSMAGLPAAMPSRALAAETCLVADPTGTPLNVRAGPNGPVIRALGNGTAVRIVASRSEEGRTWALVASPSGQDLGWVSRSFIRCDASTARPAGANGGCVVADPTGTPLNVRATPNGPVLRALPNGESLRILSATEHDGKPWALVASPHGAELGWVIRSHLACARAAPAPSPTTVERPPPSRPQPEPRPQSLAARPAPPEPVVAPLPSPPRLDALTAPVGAGKRVALVVGNGRYSHATALTNPVNDAADVAAALKGMGFDVVEGTDLDFQGFRGAVRSFSQKLDGAAVALFFYAGHGLQVGAKNYLVPVDAKLENAGDLGLDAVNVETVTRAMEGEERVNLVLLDACRDNPFTRSLKRSLGASRSAAVGAGLAPIRTAGGTLVAFATDPDNVALDGEGTRNSPFTTALLNHMRKPGIEIEAMMKRVRGEVIQATRGKQTPWSNSSLTKDVFLVPGG